MRAWLSCALLMILWNSAVLASGHYPVSRGLIEEWKGSVKEGNRLLKDVSWAVNSSREKGQMNRVVELVFAAEELSKTADIVGLSFDLIKIEEAHGFYEDESVKPLALMRVHLGNHLGTINQKIVMLEGVLARMRDAVSIRYLEKTRDYLKKVQGLLASSLEQSQAFKK
ncbi:MAG: hypothetical protein HQL21_02530 [Candidatus Omnitrophica bacterium]|nr:hypothetical protein [Candidatus Omnitrophota bacterium]